MEQKTGMRGDIVMWCSECDRFIACRPGSGMLVCRRCGEEMVRRKCTRCGHEWVPNRKDSVAKKCPKCKSPYWNRARTREDVL